ncbi:endonuclease-reverse transcriptase [Vairimorpha ceranae]|uniref:Endonuclease-reverse transcriptase n=2 Tax=Vairimorpha ceranae TaxID=40302 RepID=A0A0F9ZBM3_9MICR|nr:endonuclease-reverse transcriptase [Vairimorpha ceranae]KKO75094.1 endonuclease-reverse transcriptase [Vairimorpha ceranae]
MAVKGFSKRPTVWPMQHWDISDHFPVYVKIMWEKPLPPEEKTIISRTKVKDVRPQFVEDEKWEAVTGKVDADLSILTKAFIDTVWEVAKGCNATKKLSQKEWRVHISKETRSLIMRRRKAFKHRNDPNFDRTVYDDLKMRVQKAKKKDACEARTRKSQAIAKMVVENRYRDLFREIRSSTGDGVSDKPVLDDYTGNVIHDKKGKEELWARHFGDLASDKTGHSRDLEYWNSKFPKKCEAFPECDESLSYEDLRIALKTTPWGKAPGLDGIPADILKVISMEEEPESKAAQALWITVRAIWNEAVIPREINVGEVVPIPKKVMSVVNMGDTRGIALLPSLTKVVAKIAANRISQIAETHGLLAKEQAGFRTLEECTAQVATLYEVVKRRSIRNQSTYLAFIDYAKAYDKVPQGALLRKLESIGIGGHLLQVVKSLYEDPRMCVRVGSSTSPVVNYHCGVRQGCPASPILFDLFINDLLQGMDGVAIPGVSEAVSGLLFADDAVVMAESESALRRNLDLLTSWSEKHEMSVNASKCGIMKIRATEDVIAGGPNFLQPNKKARVEQQEPEPFEIMGNVVPEVSEYIYLGIRFTPDLCLNSMMQHVESKGRKAIGAMYYLLSKKDMPVYVKILSIKVKLQSILTYGAEVWGMSTLRCKGIQRIMNEACRLVVGGGRNAAMDRIRSELGIQSVANIAAVKRARAVAKWPGCKTWIATLSTSQFRSREWTWVTGNIKWLKRYAGWNAGGELTKVMIDNVFSVRETDTRTKIGAWAAEYNLTAKPRWIKLGCLYPDLQRGCLGIGRMRSGTFNFVRNLVNKRVLDNRFRSFCPFCKDSVVETIEHLFFFCQRWDEYRDHYFKWWSTGASQYVKNSNNSMSVVLQALLRILLGEEAGSDVLVVLYTGFGNSVLIDQTGADSFVLSAARFLQRIIPLREGMIQRVLSDDQRFSWSQSPMGMAELDAP